MDNRFRFTKVRDVHSPNRANSGDAGLDFYVPEDLTEADLYNCNQHCRGYRLEKSDDHPARVLSIYIQPHQRILIPSGIKVLLEPKDSMLMAANKSGISSKKGLIFTAEIVDSPYVGEIHLGVYNTSDMIVKIPAGSKLIQFIHVPIFLTTPEEIENGEFYTESQMWGSRGGNGFGSSDNIK